MTWTWAGIVRSSLADSGVLGTNQPINPTLTALGYEKLEQVLDELDGDGLALPQEVNVAFNTTAGESRYLLGGTLPGGTSNSTVANTTGIASFTLSSYEGVFVPGGQVTATSGSDATLVGTVVSIVNDVLVVDVSSATGTAGSFTPWDIVVNSFRPETIVSANVVITPALPAQTQQLTPLDYNTYRRYVQVPSSSGQPYNYAINPTWPEMEIYLYPTPAQAYRINFYCKLKWKDCVKDPQYFPLSTVQAQSGYNNAIINLLALRIAERQRMETATLQNKARMAKSFILQQIKNQMPPLDSTIPQGIYSWNIIKSGSNP